MESERNKNVKFLLHCAKFGDLERVKLFIEERNVDVNSTDEVGCTALHTAACEGYNEIVEYLLSKGANVDHKTECDDPELSGITPLDYTVKNEHLDAAKTLI